MGTQRAVVLAIAAGLLASLATVPRPAAAADPVLVGAGDIADCSTAAASETARLLDQIPGTVFTLGDNAYPRGSAEDFRRCYEPTWGRHAGRTRPAPGNHDYETEGADGYFDYFDPDPGARGQGWYSYQRGTWHIVVLNSNCDAVGGCGPDSPQVRWLKGDLAAHAGRNVLAYWHHPRFSSGPHGDDTRTQTFWDVLYANGADVVLNGHEHTYERFAPQDPSGGADDRHGIRQFVVGTGGADLSERVSQAENSEVFGATHGVLRLVLKAGSYAWRFVPVDGQTFSDEGSDVTHAAPGGLRTKAVAASADAFVDQSHPGARYGTRARLQVDADTGAGLDRETYLRFRVTGLVGEVRGAFIRLRVTQGTRDGPRIAATSSAWTERTITWRRRPAAVGGALDDLGLTPTGSWAYLDVTALVDGDGTYGFVLRTRSRDGVTFESREAAHAPRLIVQTVPGSPD